MLLWKCLLFPLFLHLLLWSVSWKSIKINKHSVNFLYSLVTPILQTLFKLFPSTLVNGRAESAIESSTFFQTLAASVFQSFPLRSSRLQGLFLQQEWPYSSTWPSFNCLFHSTSNFSAKHCYTLTLRTSLSLIGAIISIILPNEPIHQSRRCFFFSSLRNYLAW